MARNKSAKLKELIKSNKDKFAGVPEFALIRTFKNNKKLYKKLRAKLQRDRLHNWRRDKQHLSKKAKGE